MAQLQIGTFFEAPKTDHTQPQCVTRRQFYGFRNHVLRVLRKFGSAGPMGEADVSARAYAEANEFEGDLTHDPGLEDGDDEELEFEKEIVHNPDFFVVDDWYNEYDKQSFVECAPEQIKAGLLDSLAEMAGAFPGWWIRFSLGDSGIQASANRVFIGGRRFWDCETVEEIAERCSKPVDFGSAGPFPDSMYELWVAAVSGEFTSSTDCEAPPDRQWAEAIRTLRAMSEDRPDGRISRLDYRQMRFDLHPETRRELVRRFLAGISTCSAQRLEEARDNILREAGEALVHAPNRVAAASLAAEISRGQAAVCDRLDPKGVVFWWDRALYSVGEPRDEVRGAIATELRGKLTSSNSLIVLSAIFGLARLRVDDIASLVDEASVANPHWSEAPGLAKWLLDLRRGRVTYPSGSFLAKS